MVQKQPIIRHPKIEDLGTGLRLAELGIPGEIFIIEPGEFFGRDGR